jgi:hypothetical protein
MKIMNNMTTKQKDLLKKMDDFLKRIQNLTHEEFLEQFINSANRNMNENNE